jgi:transcriptional regulator with XRE-family HTH domain
MIMNQERIGKFISELRKEKSMTQDQLAEKLGVTDKSISRWENGKTMPDLSMLTILSRELNVEISELLNGRRMNKEELEKLRDTINNIIEYSNEEKKVKTSKLNNYFRAGLICILIVILDNQFNLLSYIFKDNIPNFIDGALCGLGLLFEFIGFYNNNHDITLKQKKLSLFKNNK